jgi:hypothetical protein
MRWKAGNVLVLGDLDPEPIATRHIWDPINQRSAVFEETYERIDRCLDVLIRHVWGSARQEDSPAR